jgi:hypothetical protein
MIVTQTLTSGARGTQSYASQSNSMPQEFFRLASYTTRLNSTRHTVLYLYQDEFDVLLNMTIWRKETNYAKMISQFETSLVKTTMQTCDWYNCLLDRNISITLWHL